MTTHTPYLPKARRPKREHNGGTYWPGENPDVCIIEGKGYVVKMGPEQIGADGERFRQLVTVCIGPVDEQGNRIDPATTTEPRASVAEKAASGVTPNTQVVLDQPAENSHDVTPIDERILELSASGMGTRKIAKTLKAEGTVISHMTVSRKIKHSRQLGLFG